LSCRIVQANSNGSYVTTRAHGSAFPSITIVPYAGYSFAGWDPAAPATGTTNVEATAQYVAASPPTYDVGVESVVLSNGCAFHMGEGASAKLILLGKGTNTFSSSADHAGIHLGTKCTFSVASNSTAALVAQGGGPEPQALATVRTATAEPLQSMVARSMRLADQAVPGSAAATMVAAARS